MKLFINAINLSSAGGLTVTLNFLKELQACRPDDLMVYVAAPRHCGYESLESVYLRLLWVPDGANYWITRLYTDYVWVPALIQQLEPDVVFTMGNFATPTPVRQVLLLHYPHPAYPDDQEVWRRLGWLGTLNVRVRNYVFSQRLRYVDVLLVQTETIQKRIRTRYPKVPAIRLFPNAYTQLTGKTEFRLPFKKEDNVRYMLCLSRYYAHKNLEILVEVADLISQRNLPYRLLITVEPEQHRKARQLIDRIGRQAGRKVLINIGNVPTECVASLYEQVEGLLLPTLLESFTSTYVDAMHFGVPIFTSRRDFSEEVCGNCAYYFDPLSAEDILSTLHRAFNNPAQLEKHIASGRRRSMKLPTWTTVTQLGLRTMEKLHNESMMPRQTRTDTFV
ncbi:glycosyltransferase [Spirosoma fluminis]